MTQAPQVPPQFKHRAPQQDRPSWVRRHKRLSIGLAAFGALVVLGGIESATGHDKPAAAVAAPRVTVTATVTDRATATATATVTAKATVTASARASAKAEAVAAQASPSCASQAQAWATGGASQQLAALGTDFGTMQTAAQAFTTDLGNGGATPQDVSAVQSAAASMQTDAQAVEANPGPACVPGLRADLLAAGADYSADAIDADNGMNQYSAGNEAAAVSDIEAAATAMQGGTAKINDATAAIKNFTDGS